jgi:hypothetical protein
MRVKEAMVIRLRSTSTEMEVAGITIRSRSPTPEKDVAVISSKLRGNDPIKRGQLKERKGNGSREGECHGQTDHVKK